RGGPAPPPSPAAPPSSPPAPAARRRKQQYGSATVAVTSRSASASKQQYGSATAAVTSRSASASKQPWVPQRTVRFRNRCCYFAARRPSSLAGSSRWQPCEGPSRCPGEEDLRARDG